MIASLWRRTLAVYHIRRQSKDNTQVDHDLRLLTIYTILYTLAEGTVILASSLQCTFGDISNYFYSNN